MDVNCWTQRTPHRGRPDDLAGSYLHEAPDQRGVIFWTAIAAIFDRHSDSRNSARSERRDDMLGQTEGTSTRRLTARFA